MTEGCEACVAKIGELLAERDALKASTERQQAANDVLDDTVGKLAADNERLKSRVEVLLATETRLAVANERLRAELAELNKVYHVGIGGRMRLETHLAELREAANLRLQCACGDADCPRCRQLVAVLAKVKP